MRCIAPFELLCSLCNEKPLGCHLSAEGGEVFLYNPRRVAASDVHIRRWEDARVEKKLTDAHREMLRTLDRKDYRYIKVWNALLDKVWVDTWKNVEFTDQEHHLFVNEQGEHELVAIKEIPDVADGFFRTYSFRRKTRPNDTYILIWTVAGEADLLLPVTPDRLTVMKPFGTRLPVEVKQGRAVVPVGGRKYLIFAGMKETRVKELLQQAGSSRSR